MIMQLSCTCQGRANSSLYSDVDEVYTPRKTNPKKKDGKMLDVYVRACFKSLFRREISKF